MMSTRKVLGRGLEALIPVAPAAIERPQPGERVFEVATDGIEANPFQPRKHIDDEKLKELSESIKSDGVLQPVVVRRKGPKYELIMGERRLQAARLAGMASIPVVVRDVSELLLTGFRGRPGSPDAAVPAILTERVQEVVP